MSSIKWRIREYKVNLTDVDLIDIRLIQYKGKIIGFVLNYRANIKGKWHHIYRVDTCHGYLHEQRFWLGSYPIRLKQFEEVPLNILFNKLREKIEEDYKRYKKYYEEKLE